MSGLEVYVVGIGQLEVRLLGCRLQITAYPRKNFFSTFEQIIL